MSAAHDNPAHQPYRAAISSISGTVRVVASLGVVKVRIDNQPAELAAGAARLLAVELMSAAVAADRQEAAL